VVLGSLGFVMGTAVVFVSFGALFGSLGEALRAHAVGLSQVFGVVTILLGLLMAGAFDRLAPLQRDVRIHRVPGRGLAAAPVLGFTFALGWTPCIGPTLGTVLTLSASNDGTTAARGALLSVAYCLGLGLPLLVTGLAFTRAMGALAVVKRHYRALMVTGGVSLVVLGILQVTGLWAEWAGALQTRFGGWDLPL
jgi:cytochrome c-type biogenesis protein